MGKVTILAETTKDPITLAGQMAGIAYGTDTSDSARNYQRGLNCIKSGHEKVLEYADVYMIIEGYSIRVIREFARHQAGMPTFLQSSTRYINYGNFDYIIPKKIQDDPLCLDSYKICMEYISDTIKDLEAWGIPKEDANTLLPLATTTNISAKYNARTLMGMSSVRLCNRAYWEYRQLMRDILLALGSYSPEWRELTDLMVCKCDKVGWCEEEFSCGKYPKKENIEVVKIK